MTYSEVIQYLASSKAEDMSPRRLAQVCSYLATTTPMNVVVQAIETYFHDELDEVDYSHVPDGQCT